MANVVDSVKNWVKLDNHIKTLNEELKALREKRRTSEQDIIVWGDPLMKQGQKPTININDGKLRLVETKLSAPLSLRYVEERLQACLGEHQQDTIDKIMQDIKDNREYKLVQEVKRVYNKVE